MKSYSYCLHYFTLGANSVILTVDLSDSSALSTVPGWLTEIKMSSFPGIQIYLAGTKEDLVNERKVNFESLKTLADENDVFCIESSSKTGKNIDTLFCKIVDDLELSKRSNSTGNLSDSGLMSQEPFLMSSSTDENFIGASSHYQNNFRDIIFGDCCRRSNISCTIM